MDTQTIVAICSVLVVVVEIVRLAKKGDDDGQR